MGGEKQMEQGAGRLWVGSPPRGRGKVSKGIKPSDERGITPAWAGKSLSRPPAVGRAQDHPRVGGEKSWWGDEVTPKQGSPPHGRGKADGAAGRAALGWITPAWAGKSIPAIGVPGASMGSPPRGRGKECRFHQNRHCRRITPAWTGKRRSQGAAALQSGDHPRVGGEKR